MKPSRIVELANAVQENTFKVDHWLREHRLPLPTFDEDGPVDLKIESRGISEARVKAMGAALELHDLLLGPTMLLRPMLNGSLLQAVYNFDIPAKVPIHGEASFQELADACELYEPVLRRFVSHAAASRKLVEDPNVMPMLGYCFDEVYQGFANTVQSLNAMKGLEPNKTVYGLLGWNLANKTSLPCYKFYSENPSMGRRFASAMAMMAQGDHRGAQFLVNGYPWSTVCGNGKGLIVDVGGSTGHTCAAIAKIAPDLHFVVQDLPQVIENRPELMRNYDVASRIEFMSHDFFKEQPVKAPRPGARTVVNDHILPKPGTLSLLNERHVRNMDYLMLMLFNSRERKEPDWIKLFEQADIRFKFVKGWVPEGTIVASIEAVWSG
ncbi:MAG: hypothetical protein M1820_008223 [Bogoriella megaspora]|nr:MAG: hypothetical protein M1820_008223 [Bogoriella megaspora]